VDKFDSGDDVSVKCESSNPPQAASREIDQLEIDLDNHMAAGSLSNDGDVDHRTIEERVHMEIGSGKSAEPPKLYLFSGGGFCIPDEDEESQVFTYRTVLGLNYTVI